MSPWGCLGCLVFIFMACVAIMILYFSFMIVL